MSSDNSTASSPSSYISKKEERDPWEGESEGGRGKKRERKR
jgi:hypothetical protein